MPAECHWCIVCRVLNISLYEQNTHCSWDDCVLPCLIASWLSRTDQIPPKICFCYLMPRHTKPWTLIYTSVDATLHMLINPSLHPNTHSYVHLPPTERQGCNNKRSVGKRGAGQHFCVMAQLTANTGNLHTCSEVWEWFHDLSFFFFFFR